MKTTEDRIESLEAEVDRLSCQLAAALSRIESLELDKVDADDLQAVTDAADRDREAAHRRDQRIASKVEEILRALHLAPRS